MIPRMPIRRSVAPLEINKKLIYIGELEVIQYVYDTRMTIGRGWVCWGCNRKAREGRLMNWAFRINREAAPDVVMWDTIACKELLERNRVLI